MSGEKIFFGQRYVLCDRLRVSSALGVSSPFAVLIPASDAELRAAAATLVPAMLDAGCVEFCCVGSQAELLHDEIDSELERRRAFEVVTTYHADMSDALEYFIFAAGGARIYLLALIMDFPELLDDLRNFLEIS